MDDPDGWMLVLLICVEVAELTVALAVVRALMADFYLDVGFVEECCDTFDCFHALTGKDGTHRLILGGRCMVGHAHESFLGGVGDQYAIAGEKLSAGQSTGALCGGAFKRI